MKAIPGSNKTFPVKGLAGSLWGWDGKSGSDRKAYIAGALWRPRGGSRFGITEAEGSHCQVWQPDLTSGALSPQVLIPSPLRHCLAIHGARAPQTQWMEGTGCIFSFASGVVLTVLSLAVCWAHKCAVDAWVSRFPVGRMYACSETLNSLDSFLWNTGVFRFLFFPPTQEFLVSK